jgi:hypothetical protein
MNTKKRWIHAIVVFTTTMIVLTGMFSCRHDSDEINLFKDVCFDTEVLPIFKASCGKPGCHDQAGESGYILTSFPEIQKAVVPGKPEASPAYKSLFKKWSGEGMMPPNQPLSETNRTIIRIWIAQGAKNTKCDTLMPINSIVNVNPCALFQNRHE